MHYSTEPLCYLQFYTLTISSGVIVQCPGLLFAELTRVKATMIRSADTVISEQTAAASTSPPRKRACLLLAHYGTRPAVQGKPIHVCLVKVLFGIQVA